MLAMSCNESPEWHAGRVVADWGPRCPSCRASPVTAERFNGSKPLLGPVGP